MADEEAGNWVDEVAGNKADEANGASETDIISILSSVIFWIAKNKIKK